MVHRMLPSLQVKCSSSENSCSETPPASNANPSAAAQLCIWQHEMGKRRNASEKAIDPIDPQKVL